MQNIPEEELMEKEAALVAEVDRLLPDFVNSCRDKADVVIIHQDALPQTIKSTSMRFWERR